MKWKKKLQQPQYALNSEKVFLTATQPAKSVYSYLQTTRLGLTRAEVEDRQLTYGKNEVVHEQKKNPFIVFIKTFINPFIGVLTGLAYHSSSTYSWQNRENRNGRESSSSPSWWCVVPSCASGRNGKPMKPQIH